MEIIADFSISVGATFYVLGILLFAKYAKFANKVKKAKMRKRFKALGYSSAAFGITLSALFLVVGTFAWSLWALCLGFLYIAPPAY